MRTRGHRGLLAGFLPRAANSQTWRNCWPPVVPGSADSVGIATAVEAESYWLNPDAACSGGTS